MSPREIRTVAVTRYVTPLREGGSLPALVEADDDFLYVLKFRGAGQGEKALIAELLGGELARSLGLKVPELVFMELDASFSKIEGDQEIQDLLSFSVGLNLGLHYLSGAITYDPVVSVADALTASKVVLLDSLITNIDRSARNPNLLNWHKELWLIDHGASLYFHHNWSSWEAMARRTFPAIKDHVLLARATELPAAGAVVRQAWTPAVLADIVSLIPDSWLRAADPEMEPVAKRQVYVQFLQAKLAQLDVLIQEAEDARNRSL